MPPYGPTDATAVQAYWHWRDGMSLSQIVAAMADPPHNCGGRSTARDWIKRGRDIEAEHGGPLSRRRAQRERVAAALNNLRVQIDQDIHAGRLQRAAGYKLQVDILARYAQLLGLPVAPAARKLKITGGDGKSPAFPADLTSALAGLPVDELLDALAPPQKDEYR